MTTTREYIAARDSRRLAGNVASIDFGGARDTVLTVTAVGSGTIEAGMILQTEPMRRPRWSWRHPILSAHLLWYWWRNPHRSGRYLIGDKLGEGTYRLAVPRVNTPLKER